MKTSDVDILMVPGLGGEMPDHWQARWQARLPTARRIDPPDGPPTLTLSWRDALIAGVSRASRPVVIVAHSVGVLLTVVAARDIPEGRIAGAFLAAPPDTDAVADYVGDPEMLTRLRAAPLPFPALVVASRTDSYGSFEHTERCAIAWGATVLDAGAAGHLDAASGYGPWPEGLMSFAGFLKKLG